MEPELQLKQMRDAGTFRPTNRADTRERHRRPVPRNGRVDWYRIENKTAKSADVYIYDEIGYWGITASDFVKEIQDLTADTITLHINSPGGEVWDGIAIFNAIKNHKATVTTVVDGIAASAASFIAMAGNTVQMEPNAQMMIHNAQGVCFGDHNAMRVTGDLLEKCNANIASMYAKKTGKPDATWLTAMDKNNGDGTWYSAQEAVDSGLADEVNGEDASTDKTQNAFDVRFFSMSRHLNEAELPTLDLDDEPETPVDDPAPDDPAAVDDGPARTAPSDDPAGEADPQEGGIVPQDEAIVTDLATLLRDSVRTTVAPPVVPFDADSFRTIMAEAARNMPAPPDTTTPAEPADPGFEFPGATFADALRNAIITTA